MPTPAAEVRDEFCPSVDFSQYSRLEPQGDEEDDLHAWESISQIDQPPWEPEEPSAEALAKIHNWDPPSVPPTPRTEPEPEPEPPTPPPQQRRIIENWWDNGLVTGEAGGKMMTRHERRRSMRSVSPRKEARRPVEEPPSPTPPAEPAEPAEEPPRETTDPRSNAGGKMPANNVHRRALRSMSPRKEVRKSTEQRVEPLPPAEPAGRRAEPARETAEPGDRAGGKVPPQHAHRKALRSVSPRKEPRKPADKGSNLPPPAETARPPPETEEPEVELRKPSKWAKLKGVLQPSKEKSITGAGNRSSAAPSAGPAVRPKENPRPTSLPVSKAASRPPKPAGPKKYEGTVRLREVLGEPTKRRDHGLDESQMRLETQARQKDEERRKARDRSLSSKRSQSNSCQVVQGNETISASFLHTSLHE